MSAKEYKIVLAGAFGSGRSTFASRMVKAKADKKKIGISPALPVTLVQTEATLCKKLVIHGLTCWCAM